MKKFIFLVLIIVGLLVGPALAEIPFQLLDAWVRVVFEQELPNGTLFLEGKVIAEQNGWLWLLNSKGWIFWCRTSNIVYIELLEIDKGGDVT